MPAVAVKFVLSLHRSKQVRRVDDFVPVDKIGMMCAQPNAVRNVRAFLWRHRSEIAPSARGGCMNMRGLAGHVDGIRRFLARTRSRSLATTEGAEIAGTKLERVFCLLREFVSVAHWNPWTGFGRTGEGIKGRIAAQCFIIIKTIRVAVVQ